MEKITDENSVRDTHTFFFDSNIERETKLAFLVKCVNKKGAQSTNWIPKSKVKYVEMEHVVGGQKKKYYVPNFFIK